MCLIHQALANMREAVQSRGECSLNVIALEACYACHGLTERGTKILVLDHALLLKAYRQNALQVQKV